MATGESWICPSCHDPVLTAHCPECGEHPLQARDLTIRGFADQAVAAFTNIDSRVMRSFASLLARPGVLTVAYLQGRRRPYVQPLQLFLVANVLFFAMESFTGSSVFSTPLDAHLHRQPWDGLAQGLVSHQLADRRTTLELYAPVFDRAVATNARTLVVLMALSFAPLLSAVFYRSPRPFMVNVVFSLHFYGFVLLLFSGAMAVVSVSVLLGGPGLTSNAVDDALSIALVLACTGYLYVATRAVYGETGSVRIVKVLALTAAAAGIVLGYRFALLLITLYSA
jgi:hypothetical protein